MMGLTGGSLETVTQMIQLAVAPVFLITGIAGFLGMFTGRLTRVIDRVEEIDKYVNSHREIFCEIEDKFLEERRHFLIKRMENINYAIFAATAAGLMTAVVIISVFYSASMSVNGDDFIAGSFILAMIFLIISLILFFREIQFTNQYIKIKKKTKLG
ncbi:MAG: DUF2721 domain-containing protein [Campylobacterales bacterium]|nr:DUF2721 domain-containing protein [Campylobacterales bacterium]